MKRKSQPHVSVVMPAWNSEAYIAEAIESILNQTFQDFEFIIVDDGSTDSTSRIIQNYAERDRRIIAVSIKHSGGAAAGNTGVNLARGEWIARMDQDDIALPHRLETQVAWIKSKNLDICGSQVQTTGSRDDVFWYPEQHSAIQRELLFRVGLLHPTVIVKSEILKYNLYDNASFHDDYELWTRLATRFKMGNIPEILLVHRCHSAQVHVVEHKKCRMDFRKFRFRYFYELFPGTPLQDYLALARVSDKQPMTSISQLHRAGQWLAELADFPDPKLKQKMATRWHDTCERSQALGEECGAVYQEYKDRIEPQNPAGIISETRGTPERSLASAPPAKGSE